MVRGRGAGSGTVTWVRVRTARPCRNPERPYKPIDRSPRTRFGGRWWRELDDDRCGTRAVPLDQIRAKLDGIGRQANGQLDITPLVRIPLEGDDSPTWMVKQVLDAGAMGIVFPAISTKEQAQRAVASMRYPHQRGVAEYPNPLGIRAGAPRGGKFLLGLEPAELLRRADVWPLNPDGELFAMLMVEKPEGVKNINEILGVPGIGAVLVGTSDLTMSYRRVSGATKGLAEPWSSKSCRYSAESLSREESHLRNTRSHRRS